MTATPGDTATTILDAAEELVQHRGFNGFSYADIASELGMTKASLHYHFRGKADLGCSLLRRYTDRFVDALAAIERSSDSATGKLEAYCDIYRAVLTEGRMCLCGVLAAEYETLPHSVCEGIEEFLDRNRSWLAGLLGTGRARGNYVSRARKRTRPPASSPRSRGPS